MCSPSCVTPPEPLVPSSLVMLIVDTQMPHFDQSGATLMEKRQKDKQTVVHLQELVLTEQVTVRA